MCKNRSLATTPDIYFRRLVHALYVFCRHKERGCGWEGELSALEHHVDACPWKNSPLLEGMDRISLHPTEKRVIQATKSSMMKQIISPGPPLTHPGSAHLLSATRTKTPSSEFPVTPVMSSHLLAPKADQVVQPQMSHASILAPVIQPSYPYQSTATFPNTPQLPASGYNYQNLGVMSTIPQSYYTPLYTESQMLPGSIHPQQSLPMEYLSQEQLQGPDKKYYLWDTHTRNYSSPPLINLKNTSSLTVQLHTQKKTAPCEMFRGSAATDQNVVYFTPRDFNSVYRYTADDDEWQKLPPCPYRNSGLVVTDCGLTAVGGGAGPHCTNKLFTLQQRQWVEQYTPMNFARSSPAVVSTSDGEHMNLIVIGGECKGNDGRIAVVELFNTRSGNWSRLTNIPGHFSLPSATICGNQLYVIGRNAGFRCSLQMLLSNHQQVKSQYDIIPLWVPLPLLPVDYSSVATLCKQLVIVGGRKYGSVVDSIHQLVDGQWEKIGSLSSVRYWCLVVSPSPDKLVVVGGKVAEYSVEVCVAT